MAIVDNPQSEARESLVRRSRRLVWLTIALMSAEAVVALWSGLMANSIALVGFGLDSVIEVFAASVVIWQLRRLDEGREHRAHRLISASFFVLAAYVGTEAIQDLVRQHHPGHSPAGIALAAIAMVVMPWLARAKSRTGHKLNNAAIVAESAETKLCAYLSIVLLAGLVLNAAFGWWWADPLAALGVGALAVKEGRESWRAESCC